jgi:TonB family protein
MKKAFGLLLLLLPVLIAVAQPVTQKIAEDYLPVGSNINDTVKAGKVFTYVDQLPEFKGGQAGLSRYLATNLRYPGESMDNNVEGKVLVKFVVCEDGSLCDEVIIRGLDSSINKEVLRVVRAMPKWNPGKQNGKEVKTYFVLPVTFKFQEDIVEEKKSVTE